MALSANGQRIENADSVELNSGGAANPSVETGTDDPSSLGKAAAEGSIYLRHVANNGELYVKTDVLTTDWTKVVVGSASVSLDQAYDTGRVITADAGSVEINNAVADTTFALKIQRLPGSAAVAGGIDLDLGANAGGVAMDIDLASPDAQGLHVTQSAEINETIVLLEATGGSAVAEKLVHVSMGTTAGNGDALTIDMAANQTGVALSVNQAGSGKGAIISGGVDLGGIVKMAGAQHTTVVALSDAASIATDAATGNIFTVTLGGNRTLANPTNLDDGTYVWVITQDGVGSRTLAYDTLFKFPGGVTPVLSTAIGAVDVLTAIYDGTNLLTTFQADFS